MPRERMTISVEEGTRAMLVELAGGERKIGAYISKLVRRTYDSKKMQEVTRLEWTHDQDRQDELTTQSGEQRRRAIMAELAEAGPRGKEFHQLLRDVSQRLEGELWQKALFTDVYRRLEDLEDRLPQSETESED